MKRNLLALTAAIIVAATFASRMRMASAVPVITLDCDGKLRDVCKQCQKFGGTGTEYCEGYDRVCGTIYTCVLGPDGKTLFCGWVWTCL